MSLDGRQGLMTAPAVDPEPPFPDMVWVPGKTYLMGSDRHYREEVRRHRRPASTGSGSTGAGDEMRALPSSWRRTGHVTLAEIVPTRAGVFVGALLYTR